MPQFVINGETYEADVYLADRKGRMVTGSGRTFCTSYGSDKKRLFYFHCSNAACDRNKPNNQHNLSRRFQDDHADLDFILRQWNGNVTCVVCHAGKIWYGKWSITEPVIKIPDSPNMYDFIKTFNEAFPSTRGRS